MEQFKTAIVYGKSVKHVPQRVGLSHELADEDVGKLNWNPALIPQRVRRASRTFIILIDLARVFKISAFTGNRGYELCWLPRGTVIFASLRSFDHQLTLCCSDDCKEIARICASEAPIEGTIMTILR